MSESFDLTEVQGNILRGYKRKLVRHLFLGVRDRPTAAAFLGKAATGGVDGEVPGVTPEAPWVPRKEPPETKPDAWFNIGLTYDGAKALGLPERTLASFPTEFVEGMARRAVKIGDVGANAPKNWRAPFNRPERIHLVASIYADDAAHLDRVEGQVTKAFDLLDGGRLDGYSLPNDRVLFGYIDNISQPRFKGVVNEEQYNKADQPLDPLGTALLGHPTRVEGLTFRMPSPTDFGYNGTFNAFRVLQQDCGAFEDYLDKAARWLLEHDRSEDLLSAESEQRIIKAYADEAEKAKHQGGDAPQDRFGALREVVAAQMCGRWRLNGAPLATARHWPKPAERGPNVGPEILSLTNFDYDVEGGCPVGSHIRRNNPRGGKIVQRVASRTRRLVRRGMVYGPEFDPARRDDKAERGLLGNFIGASLGAQFEAVMYDWMNRGLQHPDITGSNDPLLGTNGRDTSWFDLKTRTEEPIRLRGFPSFVTARGGVYAFLPSLPAIEWLAAAAGRPKWPMAASAAGR